MRQLPKKTIMTLLAAGILAAVPPCPAETGPDEITIDQLANLYEPVLFYHLTHQEMYDCSRCHHGEDEEAERGCMTCHGGRPLDTQSSCSACHDPQYPADIDKKKSEQEPHNKYHIDTPGLVAAYHLQCRTCHFNESGPTGCQECHRFTEKGANYFNEDE